MLSDWRHTTTAQTLIRSIFLTLERRRFQRLAQFIPGTPSPVSGHWFKPAKKLAPGITNTATAGIEIASYHKGEEPDYSERSLITTIGSLLQRI